MALLARLRKEQSIKANSSVISDNRDISSPDDEEEGEEELSELEEGKEEKKQAAKPIKEEVKKRILPIKNVVLKKRGPKENTESLCIKVRDDCVNEENSCCRNDMMVITEKIL
jgi:hypothetical protein